MLEGLARFWGLIAASEVWKNSIFTSCYPRNLFLLYSLFTTTKEHFGWISHREYRHPVLKVNIISLGKARVVPTSSLRCQNITERLDCIISRSVSIGIEIVYSMDHGKGRTISGKLLCADGNLHTNHWKSTQDPQNHTQYSEVDWATLWWSVFSLTQILGGYECYQAYLYRIGLENSLYCPNSSNVSEDEYIFNFIARGSQFKSMNCNWGAFNTRKIKLKSKRHC